MLLLGMVIVSLAIRTAYVLVLSILQQEVHQQHAISVVLRIIWVFLRSFRMIVQELQQLLWCIKVFLQMLLLMNGLNLNRNPWHIQQLLIMSSKYVISLLIQSW
jgi:hypothetical protein